MANEFYIVPRRNDLDGMNIQTVELQPNESQKNNNLDGPGQSGYVKWSSDEPGVTTTVGDSFAGGSTQTQPLAALVDDDTTGGGDDVSVPTVAQFGLAAYFMDRVDRGAASAAFSAAEAVTAADAMLADVEGGTPPTLAAIDAVLAAVVASTGLTDGLSFGTVTEVLAILQGQVYQLRALSIITDDSDVFLSLADRQVIVDAQTPATIAAQGEFFAQGAFLARGESGFRDFRPLFRTGPLLISAGEGRLFGFKGMINWMNPNFAYAAEDVSLLRPRAFLLDGVTPVPATGTWPAVFVFDHEGNAL